MEERRNGGLFLVNDILLDEREDLNGISGFVLENGVKP